MSWAVGYDSNWKRDIGYGVPAICDHPGCNAKIDRGLSYVCGGEPYGGDDGCGLYFCSEHLFYSKHLDRPLCECCCNGSDQLPEPTPDTEEWIRHKLTHDSWAEWRDENPEWVAKAKEALMDLRDDKIKKGYQLIADPFEDRDDNAAKNIDLVGVGHTHDTNWTVSECKPSLEAVCVDPSTQPYSDTETLGVA